MLPGDGFEGDGDGLGDRQRPGRARALPRRAARLLGDALQRVRAARRACPTRSTRRRSCKASGGIFHNRVDAERLDAARRQPAVPADGHRRQRQRRQPGRRRAARSACRSPSPRRTSRSSTRRPTCGRPASSARSRGASRVDVAYVGRRGLYLQRERNINQLRPGTLQANPGVNIAALRPYKGYGAIRISENAGNSKYNSLQMSADRRYSNGFKLGVGLHVRQVGGQRQRQAQRDVEHLRRHELLGAVELRPPPRARRLLHLRPAVLARPDARCMRNLLGGWQISGASFFRTGTPFSITRTNDIAGVGDGSNGQPVQPGRRLEREREQGSSRPAPARTTNFCFNPAAFAARRRARSATRRATCSTTRASSSGTSRCSRTSTWAAAKRLQFRAEFFNFINHPNWGNVNNSSITGSVNYADPTNANFGRVHVEDQQPARRAAEPAVPVLERRAST